MELFRNFNEFLGSVERRGVGAMEIVAMDMKLRGMYIARQLSFQVQFTRNLFYKGQMEFELILSLIFQYTFLAAFGPKRLVSYLAVPYSLSL